MKKNIKPLAKMLELTPEDCRSLELAELRYRQGIDSYLTVLDAQRTHYATQQQWLLSRRGQLASEVALYQALGGNWTQERQDGL